MQGPHVIVLGGGTMGLASAWALARGGARVTVLERRDHVHGHGSHGGHTRIIRESYHEGAGYVPIVRDAARAWEALGERAGEPLLVRTGMVEYGPPDDPEYRAAIAACVASGTAHEVVDAAAARARWPFVVPDDWTACFTPSGGYLRVRACLDALRREAEAHGAVVRHFARVAEVLRAPDGVHARLESGETVRGDRMVVAAGAHLPALLPEFLPGRLRVLRRVLAWTRPDERARAELAALPVWAVFGPEGFFYGFPWCGEGVDGFKLACHFGAGGLQEGRGEDPETVDRAVHPEDLAPLTGFLARRLPAAEGPFVASSVCLYTCTPTWDFVIDRLPDDPRVVVAGGFSGHGFKFAPAIGELVGGLLLDDAPPPALAAFARARHLGTD
jgi:monomeric sarcosine oxidase